MNLTKTLVYKIALVWLISNLLGYLIQGIEGTALSNCIWLLLLGIRQLISHKRIK